MATAALASEETPSPLEEASEILMHLTQELDDPLQEAFLTRALRAIAGLTTQLGGRSLKAAVIAPTDYGVLLSALTSRSALELLTRDDPLASARLRGIQAKTRLLECEGGVLGVKDVARHLQLSRQAVDKRRKQRRLLAVERGRHGYAYPAWQFVPGGLLRGLGETLAALEGHDPWMRLAFFLNPSAALDGEPPLAALRRGPIEPVLRAARIHGEHGAS